MREKVIYWVNITRDDPDPEKEVHMHRSIPMPAEVDDELAERIFLDEARRAWIDLHRAIRKFEVGEE